jgi:hypothetical protein
MAKVSTDQFLTGYPTNVRALARQLAEVIRGVAPTASEAVKPGWGCVGFTHPEVGYFCGIFPKDDEVKVGFEFGVLLEDGGGMLTGSGTQLRYLDVSAEGDVPESALRALLEQAIALPPEVAARRAMVRDAH